MSGIRRRGSALVREAARHVVAVVLTWRTRLSSEKAGCVLVYHGVADTTGDPDREIVPPIAAPLLRSHLAFLARRYLVVPPSEIARAVAGRRRGGRLPLAVTFDDDLRSHVTHAAPVLRATGITAGFFLCGSMVAGPGGYWWEHLQAAVDTRRLNPGDVPGDDDELVEAALDGRPGAIHELARLVEELAPAARDAVTERLARHGHTGPRLETDDVRGLLRDGFEVGFHTVRHDRLPPLDDRQLDDALVDGRRELAELLGVELTAISYPHGRADTRVAAAARAAGFTLGFVGGGPPVEPAQDPLLLPRLAPTFESRGTIALEIARHLRHKAA